jgi:hypothetical protein
MNELYRAAKRGKTARLRELPASEAERSRFNEFDDRGLAWSYEPANPITFIS